MTYKEEPHPRSNGRDTEKNNSAPDGVLSAPEPVAEAPQQAVSTRKEAATKIRRLAKAATTPVKIKLDQAQAESLVDGVLAGEARLYLRFNSDGSGGEGFIDPHGHGGWSRDTIRLTGIARFARFDGGGAADFHGYDLPYGARSESASFNDTSEEASKALLALGMDSGAEGNEAGPDSESDGATCTSEDSVVAGYAERGSWFADFAAEDARHSPQA